MTLYRARCSRDLGLPVDAKTRLVNLAIDDMDAPIRSRSQCRIVGDDHDRLAVVGDIAQYAEHLLRRSSVEISRGLVGDDDFGAVGKRPRPRPPPPPTPGKLIW